MAISVAVPVTDAVADALIARLVPKFEALKIGPAADRASEMGLVVTAAAAARIKDLIGKGVGKSLNRVSGAICCRYRELLAPPYGA